MSISLRRSLISRARGWVQQVFPQAVPSLVRTGNQLPTHQERTPPSQVLHSSRGGEGVRRPRCFRRYRAPQPTVRLQDRCTACGLCVDVCPEERPNQFDYGMSATKAIYLPHQMAMPMKYVIEEGYCQGDSCSKCVQVCPTDAIDLRMTASTLNLKVASIIVATGWKPYDATQLELLGFQYPNVISNVMMERLTAPNGPTKGKLLRPSDGKPCQAGRFRPVRWVPRREPPALLLCHLLPLLPQGSNFRARAVPPKTPASTSSTSTSAPRGTWRLFTAKWSRTRISASSRARWPRWKKTPLPAISS